MPEWARPQQGGKRRHAKGKGGGPAGKRERLQKVMAQSGHGSRRNIEILIAQGHLTINGQVAKLGDLVGPGDRVKLDGATISLRFGEAMPRVMLYHKPEGEIVTRDDPQGRATVFEKLPRVNGGRWVSVGRLDINTGGLLIFTTSGELANRLTHPRFEVEREYAVRLLGPLTDEARAKLLAGVELDGESCRFDSIEDRGGEGANHWVHVILREGRNREVRRLFEAVGVTVSRLMRVRFGCVELPSFVKRGQLRELGEDEVATLLAFAGMAGEAKERGEGEEEEEEEEDEVNGNRAPEGALPAEREYEIEDDDWQPDWSRFPDPNRPQAPRPQAAQGEGQPGGPRRKKGGPRHKKGGPKGQGGQQQPHKQGAQQPRTGGQPGGGQPGGGGPKPGGGGKPGGRRGRRHRNRQGKGQGQGPPQGQPQGQPQQAQPQGQPQGESQRQSFGDEQPKNNDNGRSW